MSLKPLIIDHTSIILDKKTTYFSSDLASANSSLTADSIVGFAINQVLLLGNIGQEKAEIILTHASTAPTGSTITLASATAFAHSRGDKVALLDWNQIEISHATTSSGSKTVITTIAIQVDQQKTIYNDTTYTSGYYFYRYKNSIDGTFSDYSDAIPYAGFADNSVFMIKDRAMKDLGIDYDDKITSAYLNTSLWEARRDLDNDEKILRFSFRTKFNSNIGQIAPGTWKVACPTDLRDPNTNKNILALRIGKKNRPLEYQDINRFNENFRNVAHTTLNGTITSLSTSLTLTKSGDFDDSGSLYFAGADASETVDIVAYTANDEVTNILTGVTGIQTAGHADGTDVWQGVNFGEPIYYTVNQGYIYFNIPFMDDLAGEYIYMDYYSTLLVYDTDGDILDEPEYDMFVSYLKYKIKYLKANGAIDITKDPDYLEWVKRKTNMINKELIGQTIYLVPDME